MKNGINPHAGVVDTSTGTMIVALKLAMLKLLKCSVYAFPCEAKYHTRMKFRWYRDGHSS